jgi:hypothetical protein
VDLADLLFLYQNYNQVNLYVQVRQVKKLNFLSIFIVLIGVFCIGVSAQEILISTFYIESEKSKDIFSKFDFVDFSDEDDLGLVKKGDKYGYIKKNGDIVIPIQFDDATHFNKESRALVMVNGSYTYINKLSLKNF